MNWCRRDTVMTALRAAGWISVVIIAILSVVPGESRPHLVSSGRLEHVAAYCGTALLFALGYFEHQRMFVIGGLLTAYAGCLETAQVWIPERHSSVLDFTASALGAWLGILCVSLLVATRQQASASGRQDAR